MTRKTCFRCDWQGEPDKPACPNCGTEPLYVDATDPPPEADAPSSTPEPEAEAAPAESVDPPSRSNRRLVVGAGLVALVLLVAWLVANIDRPVSLEADPGVSPSAFVATGSSSSPTPDGPQPRGVRTGTHTVEVRAVTLSFDVPTRGWQQFGDLYITKSSVGPQGAEAIIYWTGIGGSNGAHACGQWWGAPPGSIEDYAKSATKMSGADLVTGPWDVTLGGLTAAHAALVVRKSRGCDPGWFYRWPVVIQGAFWDGTAVGDTIRIWIVDVERTRIYIEADTHKNAGRKLSREVQKIVESIRLSTTPRS